MFSQGVLMCFIGQIPWIRGADLFRIIDCENEKNDEIHKDIV